MVLSRIMKLIFDHQIFAMQTFGGISRYFAELGKQLGAQNDIDLTVLAPFHINSYFDGMDSRITFGQRIPKIPKTGRLMRPLNKYTSRSWLRKHPPQIIHSTYYYPQDNYFRGIKVVVTVHDMIHEQFPQDFPSSDRTATLKYKAVQSADHVICVSQKTRDDLIKIIPVDPKKVSVVHHGLNCITQVADVSPLTSSSPYLLYVGAREGYKNFSTLLRAYAGCAELNANMKLICFGGGKFSTKELSTFRHLGLRDEQLEWFGGGDPVLASLYKHASAFVYPSQYEGFGMPLSSEK